MDELADMIGEIKRLDPKPGLRYGRIEVQHVVPDVVRPPRPTGAGSSNSTATRCPAFWSTAAISPRSPRPRSEKDKGYLVECLQTANWLAKSPRPARARSSRWPRRSCASRTGLTHGVQHLRPLNLRTVADAISMHESTVSRVTSNKYLSTPRGIFELKYFFTSAISSEHGEAHSSEAVRHRIRQLIDGEAREVLSDDMIVEKLKSNGIDIARRTVAKYREAMRIPSLRAAPAREAAHRPARRGGAPRPRQPANAGMPVMARPRIRAWMSWVPS